MTRRSWLAVSHQRYGFTLKIEFGPNQLLREIELKPRRVWVTSTVRLRLFRGEICRGGVCESGVCESGICESGICESGVCESGICESGVCESGIWNQTRET